MLLINYFIENFNYLKKNVFMNITYWIDSFFLLTSLTS